MSVNSVDPDQTPQNAASDLDLYCLIWPVCPKIEGIYGKSMASVFRTNVHNESIFKRDVQRENDPYTICEWLSPDQPAHSIRGFSVISFNICYSVELFCDRATMQNRVHKLLWTIHSYIMIHYSRSVI